MSAREEAVILPSDTLYSKLRDRMGWLVFPCCNVTIRLDLTTWSRQGDAVPDTQLRLSAESLGPFVG